MLAKHPRGAALGAFLVVLPVLSAVNAQPVPDPEPALRALLEVAQGELQEAQRFLGLVVQEVQALAEQRLQRVLVILQEAKGPLDAAARDLAVRAEAAVAAAQAALQEAQNALTQAAQVALAQAQGAVAAAQAALQEVSDTVGQAVQDAIARAQAEAAAAQALLQGTAQQALTRAAAELGAAQEALQEAANAVGQASQAALAAAQAEATRLAGEVGAAARGALAAAEAALQQAEAQARSSARAALLAGPVVVWTSLNMGSGSGLDADLLDGFQALDFLDRIAVEAATRASEDAALHERLDTLKLEVQEAIAAEAAAREAGHARLAEAIAGEVADRKAEVARLEALLAREAGERAAADGAEATARAAADLALRGGLDREASDRAAADATEAGSRAAADGALHARIDGVEASVPERAWSAVLARDGPGSTLDADTLDGLGSGQLLRSDRSGSLAGSLDVAGSVKLGDDVAACSPEKAGSLRYRDGHFYGCDGSQWRQLDNAPGPPASCRTIKDAKPSASNGLYTIDPNGGDSGDAFEAYCDMATDGGGWTLVYNNLFSGNEGGPTPEQTRSTYGTVGLNNDFAVNPQAVFAQTGAAQMLVKEDSRWLRFNSMTSDLFNRFWDTCLPDACYNTYSILSSNGQTYSRYDGHHSQGSGVHQVGSSPGNSGVIFEYNFLTGSRDTNHYWHIWPDANGSYAINEGVGGDRRGSIWVR